VRVCSPGDWTVLRGHQLLERLEGDIRHALPDALMFTHLEALGDPASSDDVALERDEKARATPATAHCLTTPDVKPDASAS
jgi:hypothetical protein